MPRMTASVPFGPGLDTSMPIAADPPLHAHWRFTATSNCIRRPSASVFADLARRSTFSRLGSKKSHRAVQTPEGKPVRNWSGSGVFLYVIVHKLFLGFLHPIVQLLHETLYTSSTCCQLLMQKLHFHYRTKLHYARFLSNSNCRCLSAKYWFASMGSS